MALAVTLSATSVGAWSIRPTGDGFASAVAVDAARNVVAGGQVFTNPATDDRDMFLIKLAPNGTILWQRSLTGGAVAGPYEGVGAIAVAGADLLVGGGLQTAPSVSGMGGSFAVLRLASSDGDELWRYELSDPADVGGYVVAMAVDGNGDVVAAGYTGGVAGAGNGGQLAVAKLSGTTGNEIWRRAIGSPGSQANTVAITASGDVVVGGRNEPGALFYVTKLAGSTGATVWQYSRPGLQVGSYSEYASSLALDTSGDVVAAGRLGTATFEAPPLFVAKLSAADGSELWHHETPGDPTPFPGTPYYGAQANALVLLPSGDAIVSGSLHATFGSRYVVQRLAGSDGHEMWRSEPNAAWPGSGEDVGLNQDGDVVTTGWVADDTANQTPHLSVLRLDGQTGAIEWQTDHLDRGSGSKLEIDAGGAAIVVGAEGPDPQEFTVVKYGGSTGSACGDARVDAGEECDDGNSTTEDGCDTLCRTEQQLTETVPPGGTATTDPGGGPTATLPVTTAVTSPDGGEVSILQTSPEDAAPTGYRFLDREVEITAPAGTAAIPLTIVFELDASAIVGEDESSIAVFRNGAIVPACTGPAGTASPDPCVAERTSLASGGVRLAVLTSAASRWNLARASCVLSTACSATTPPIKSLLKIKQPTRGAARMVWKWTRGANATPSALGNPIGQDDYRLCVFDGATPSLWLFVKAPAGGICDGDPCWSASASGFRYRDTAGTPDGVERLTVKAGDQGRAKLGLIAKEGAVRASSLRQLDLPIRVQLQSKTGDCWETIFSAAGVAKSTATQLRAFAE
jgi:cysteine-rich repeat protein